MQIKLELKRELDKLMKDLSHAKASHIPYALSKAVNETAVEAQRIIRQEFERELQIRNKGLLKKAIQVNFSNKNQFPYIEAEVGILTNFDFLKDHVTGKQREALSRMGKAIPNLEEIKRSSSGKMAAAKRPKQLLERKNVFKLETRKGPVIAKRVGKSKYPIKILYGFKKNVKIFERVEFFAAIESATTKGFNHRFGNHLAAAIRSAK